MRHHQLLPRLPLDVRKHNRILASWNFREWRHPLLIRLLMQLIECMHNFSILLAQSSIRKILWQIAGHEDVWKVSLNSVERVFNDAIMSVKAMISVFNNQCQSRCIAPLQYSIALKHLACRLTIFPFEASFAYERTFSDSLCQMGDPLPLIFLVWWPPSIAPCIYVPATRAQSSHLRLTRAPHLQEDGESDSAYALRKIGTVFSDNGFTKLRFDWKITAAVRLAQLPAAEMDWARLITALTAWDWMHRLVSGNLRTSFFLCTFEYLLGLLFNLCTAKCDLLSKLNQCFKCWNDEC